MRDVFPAIGIEFFEVSKLVTAKQKIMGLFGALSMAALILDAQTALGSAKEAINLCITVLIPSLFTFFICSNLLTASASGSLQIAKPLCRLMRIPSGSESILAVGLFGGYPAGAQAVATSCRTGRIDSAAGKRMLAFCSNAGPAFFFGIGMQIFHNVWLCLLCWLIHIISAFAVALMTPGKAVDTQGSSQSAPITLTQAMQNALRAMAAVCGWVVVMRTFLGLLDRWILWMLPNVARSMVGGFLELTSGCCALIGSNNIGAAFILFSAYTAFGGLCVWLQTMSVVSDQADCGAYLPGKVTQMCICVLLAWIIQSFLPPEDRCALPLWIAAACVLWCAVYIIFSAKRKIAVEINGNMVYNQVKATGGIL